MPYDEEMMDMEGMDWEALAAMEEEGEEEYQPRSDGIMSRMNQAADDAVGEPELMDLLGPDMGHGDDEPAPMPLGSPEMGLGEEISPQMGEDRTFEDPAAQRDARAMLAQRAQERLAASQEFQSRAFQIQKNSMGSR